MKRGNIWDSSVVVLLVVLLYYCLWISGKSRHTRQNSSFGFFTRTEMNYGALQAINAVMNRIDYGFFTQGFLDALKNVQWKREATKKVLYTIHLVRGAITIWPPQPDLSSKEFQLQFFIYSLIIEQMLLYSDDISSIVLCWVKGPMPRFLVQRLETAAKQTWMSDTLNCMELLWCLGHLKPHKRFSRVWVRPKSTTLTKFSPCYPI